MSSFFHFMSERGAFSIIMSHYLLGKKFINKITFNKSSCFLFYILEGYNVKIIERPVMR
jgi:hypothetical protein